MAVSDEVARRNWRRPLTGVAVVAVIGAGLGAYLGIRVAQGSGSAPAAGQPPARTEAAMAYDAADGTLVLFGGQGNPEASATPGRGTDPPGPRLIRPSPHRRLPARRWPTTR